MVTFIVGSEGEEKTFLVHKGKISIMLLQYCRNQWGFPISCSKNKIPRISPASRDFLCKKYCTGPSAHILQNMHATGHQS